MSSSRGLRVIKAMEFYCKNLPNKYDVSTVLNKINIISMSQGCTKATFTVDNSMSNAGGTLHGGYIASVIDVLSFFSILSDTKGKLAWTTNLNVDFIKSAAIGEKVTVETKLLKDDSPVLAVRFHNEVGAMLARGTASFQIGGDKFQNMAKELFHFDVYEN